MITFHSPADWFKTNGLRLVYAQLFNFIICLPPFHIGAWIQVEPLALFIYLSGILTCGWLAIGLYKKWLVIETPVHPLFYVLCAWAMWQAVVSFLSPSPMMSFLGPAEHGEGGAYHIVLVLTIFLISPFWNEERFRKKILATATASLCIMAFLHFDMRMIHDPNAGTDKAYSFYHVHNPYAPSNWPDYLPFIACWLWIAYAAAEKIRAKPLSLAAGVLFFAILLLSYNKSAQIILSTLFIAMIIALIALAKTKENSSLACFLRNQKIWKTLAVIGILLPLGWIVISQYYNFKETASLHEKNEEFTKTCKPEYAMLCSHMDITERASFNRIVWRSLMDEPTYLVFGKGWNSFSNDLFKYHMFDGAHSYKNGQLDPNFGNLLGYGINNYDFHSHNQQATALHSLGVIGLLLFLAIPIFAIFFIKKELFWWCVPIIIGVSAIGVFWFTVGKILAFQALGIAALCSARKEVSPTHSKAIPRYFAIIPAVTSLLMASCFMEQGRGILYAVTFYQLKFAKSTPIPPDDKEWMASDFVRGSDRLVFFMVDYANNVANKIENGKATINDHDWYRDFLNIAKRMGTAEHANAFMRIFEPHLSMKLLFDFKKPSHLDSLKPEVKKSIVDSVMRFTETAPEREDFVAPFFIHLYEITDGDAIKQREILEKTLTIAPNHRIALWLLGGIYEQTSEHATQGKEMKERAIALGLDKVYPVKLN